MKLFPPSVSSPAQMTHAASHLMSDEPIAAMVSTTQGNTPSDPSEGLISAVKQLSKDVHDLRL